MVKSTAIIRRALPSDVPEIAPLNVRAWQVAYRGQMPDGFLNALDTSERAAWWAEMVVAPHLTVLVGVDAVSVIGFCSSTASRDDDASAGTCELRTLYVEPNRWRSGIGSALLDAALDSAREQAFHELSLWVLETNLAARRFYEARGFAADGYSKTDSRLGVQLHEVRYRRPIPERSC